MRLVEVPSLRPYVCLDRSQAGPVVDTLIQPPGYGRVYLSRRHVEEAAGLFGMVSAAFHAAVVGERDVSRRRVAELEGELAELTPVRDALDRAAARYGEAA